MDEPTVVLPDLDRQPRHTLSSGHRNRRRPGILMLIAHFPPAIGGTETQAHTLATGIARLGHRVTVLTLARTGDPAREMLDGVAVERALAGVGRGVLYAATYGISLLRHLRRIRTGHGVLHAYHLYLEAMAAVWLGRRFDLPAIARIACGGIDGDFSRLRRTGLIWGLPLLRRLHRVVAISAETEAELEAHGFGADRVVRIPNG
ncbi:MAG TPA: glycosyltransferase family 4 protein, partial [Candidatus Methylomirabilis sp.]|nr:glycosyltransferase family 4 protein [Candidatus Methylomirabilis sp.]